MGIQPTFDHQAPYGPYSAVQRHLRAVGPPPWPDTNERWVLGRKLPQHASNGALRDLKLGRELRERR